MCHCCGSVGSSLPPVLYFHHNSIRPGRTLACISANKPPFLDIYSTESSIFFARKNRCGSASPMCMCSFFSPRASRTSGVRDDSSITLLHSVWGIRNDAIACFVLSSQFGRTGIYVPFANDFACTEVYGFLTPQLTAEPTPYRLFPGRCAYLLLHNKIEQGDTKPTFFLRQRQEIDLRKCDQRRAQNTTRTVNTIN